VTVRAGGAVEHAPPAQKLWRNPAFAVFWSARTISSAGTGITMVVLPVLVYGMTHSPAAVASLAAIEALPYLGLGLFAGALSDRVDRRKIMVVCDVGAAFLLFSVPLAAAVRQLAMAQILIVALGVATAYVWFDAANFGALPALVDRARLPAASSIV
jgi:MFS family permease